MAARPIETTDEQWEELSKNLPKKDDPFILNYLEGRTKLIAEEHKQRSDASFRKNMSPIAKKACEIVARVRAEEQEQIWTAKLEEQIAMESQGITVHPGMMFSLAKGIMEKTKLWRVVRRLPKGALLHAHCDAMVDFDYVLEVLLSTPGIHILSSGTALSTREGRENGNVSFRFFKQEHVSGTIWQADYKPNTPILLAHAADAFPDGGRQGFLTWLKSRCVISTTDSVEQHHGLDHVWRKFTQCFMTIGTIIHYEPIWRAFLRRLMSSLYADGVYWTEVRFTWPLNYHREGREEPETDYSHMFRVIDEEVTAFRASEEGKGFWGLRMIWTSMRSADTRSLLTHMDHAITTKIEFPHLLAGYDLVGQEDLGLPLRDRLTELFWFRQQCAEEGVEMPFFFHAGECLGDGNDTDNNLFDAVLLGTRRIGHGFSLYKHPLLIDLVRDKRILVESCPISNEVLRLCGSVLSHPLPALLARGVPCALCNDDPAILGQDTEGMTHDFWQALQGWDNLGLAGLGSLAENSVRWAAFEDQDADAWARDIREASLGSGVKAERLKQWGVEWEKFCLWVVTEYGEQYGE